MNASIVLRLTAGRLLLDPLAVVSAPTSWRALLRRPWTAGQSLWRAPKRMMLIDDGHSRWDYASNSIMAVHPGHRRQVL